MKRLLLICMLLGWLIPEAIAQRQVTGTVTDGDTGDGLPGVNVRVQGTSTGVVTNFDGEYRLEVPGPDATLSFSFIGYLPQNVRVGDQSTINVTLQPDVQQLEEVVVVGYGEMRKQDLTSAHVSVSSKEIEQTVNTTIEQAIQGRAAGVYVTQNTGQPGGGVSVNIRGINSITGSTEPLYVIDGVQIAPGNVSYGSASSANPLAGLNPADIESMEILQGPSATAIYGSRGTNGVVLITTKRGKAGQMNINYGFTYSLQDRPQQLDVMNLRQYAQMVNDYNEIAGGTPPAAFADPSILGEGTNWQEELFRRAPLMKHQLSLSGGSEKTTFYLSGEYFEQEGIAIGSSFDRYSVRLNVDNETRDWLQLATNLSFNQTTEQIATTQENVINNAIGLAPHIPVRNPDGSWGGADATNGAAVQYTPLNPIAIASLIDNSRNRSQFLGGVNATVNIMEGLTFRTSFNGDVNFTTGDYFIPTYQLGARSNQEARLSSIANTNTYWNWNQLLQYNNTFGKHSVGVMVSHEAQESYWRNLSGGRQGFLSNDLADLNLGNVTGATNEGGRGDWGMESYLGRLNYTFDERYIFQGAFRADGSSNFGPENRWGYFPSLSAAWRISEEGFFQENIGFISELKLRFETGLTGNQGGGGNQFAPLRTVGTPWGSGFNVQRYGNPDLQWEETLTNNLGFNLNFLQNRVQLEGDFYIKQTDNLLMRNPLPWYMGTEAEGNIDAPIVNIGALENRGMAFTLNTINVDNAGFTWSTNFNISTFRTKITELYSESAFLDRTSWYMGDWTQRAEIGQAPWLFRGYEELGLWQSVEDIQNGAVPVNSAGDRLAADPDNGVWVGDVRYRDQNGDGLIDERDQVNIGNPWPDFTFGFTNTFTYKGFNLMVLLTGSQGNDIFNYVRFSNTDPNNINLGRNLFEETFNYAKLGGDEDNPVLLNPDTHIPRLTYNPANGNANRFTDKFVEDGSYIRIKNINLSYNLSQHVLGNQNVVKGARLSVGVQNLATFTRYKGYDPEVGAYVGRDVDPNNQAIGLDFGRYPITPMYTVSVGIDF